MATSPNPPSVINALKLGDVKKKLVKQNSEQFFNNLYREVGAAKAGENVEEVPIEHKMRTGAVGILAQTRQYFADTVSAANNAAWNLLFTQLEGEFEQMVKDADDMADVNKRDPNERTYSSNALNVDAIPPTANAEDSWENWNINQTTKAHVERPNSLAEMQQTLKNNKKKHIRVAGYGHSWSPIVATQQDNDDTLLIVTRGKLNKVLSSTADVVKTGNVTFEAGVSVAGLQTWIDQHKIQWTLPANVVLTEVYLAALATCMCHGAGYEWGSVADMISAISILDAEGNLTTYSDAPLAELAIPAGPLAKAYQKLSSEEFNQYKGTLGTLGVIYAMTLKMVPAVTVEMKEQLLPVDVLMDAKKMQDLVEEYDGWIEIFWIPHAPNIVVQTWKRAPTQEAKPFDHKTQDYIGGLGTRAMYRIRQFVQLTGIPVPTWVKNKFLELIYHGLVLSVGVGGQVHYYRWYDAIHYRDYIDNMKVEDTEFAIPINAAGAVPYKAAADAFKIVYDACMGPRNAVDICVEMRYTMGSHAVLSHFPISTATKWIHLEFLSYSVANTHLETKWLDFVQEISQQWMKLGGNPHWAKGWHTITGAQDHYRKIPGVQKFAAYRKTKDPEGRFLNTALTNVLCDPATNNKRKASR